MGDQLKQIGSAAPSAVVSIAAPYRVPPIRSVLFPGRHFLTILGILFKTKGS